MVDSKTDKNYSLYREQTSLQIAALYAHHFIDVCASAQRYGCSAITLRYGRDEHDGNAHVYARA